MAHCINISHPKYKELLNKSGLNPILLSAKVMLWQQSNGLDEFPTLEEGVLEELAVNEPEQIHILSSKADIQGFKDFMSKTTKSNDIVKSVVEKTENVIESNNNNNLDSKPANKGILYGKNEKKNYDEILKYYLKTGNIFYANTENEAYVKYDNLVKIYGKDFVNKPFNIGLSYKIYVKKPKISKTETSLDINYKQNYKDWWDNLSDDEKFRETEYSDLDNKNGNIKDLELRFKYFKNGDTTTTVDILTLISKSNHPLNKLAEHLIEFAKVNNIKITLFKGSNSDAAGRFSQDKNEIFIWEDSLFRGLGSEPTIIHEILHSLSYTELKGNNKAKVNFEKIFNYAKQVLPKDYYGLTNLDEFLTELYTNAEFIKTLQNTKALNNEKYDNLFEELLDYILGLFKITSEDLTLYDQAFAVSSQILTNFKESQIRNEEYNNLNNRTQTIQDKAQDILNEHGLPNGDSTDPDLHCNK